MRMVRVGGHLILNVPVNNFPGHGFYQISPELLFGRFPQRFGYRFSMTRSCWSSTIPDPSGSGVIDPAAVGHRVMFRSHSRTVIWVLAERIGPVPEFQSPPRHRATTPPGGNVPMLPSRRQSTAARCRLLKTSAQGVPAPWSVGRRAPLPTGWRGSLGGTFPILSLGTFR